MAAITILYGLFLLFTPYEASKELQKTGEIAFSADLSENKEMSGDVTIVFDRVMTNVGELYVNNSGQFICSDDGLYVFIWSVCKASGTDITGMRCISKLSRGGLDQKYGPKTDYYNTGFSGVAEMMTVIQCTPLTAITVITVPWSEEIGTTAIFRHSFTSFSGFKLLHNTAFAAEVSKEHYLFDSSKIRFDKVLVNFGEYYDPFHHFFRCPDDGVYVFGISTYTRDPDIPWSVSRLMMDGSVVVQGPITFQATEDYDSGSASSTAVLQCQRGSSVYVEAQAAHDFPYNSYGAELTSFTGYKLYDVAEGVIAFFTVMSQNHTTTYDNQPFVFDDMITNIGNAFDEDLSHFTCPDDDYYLFTWGTVANYGGGDANVDLHRDGEFVKPLAVTPKSQTDEDGTSGSSSKSVIVQCSEGSRFSVVGREVQPRVYLGGYTTFAGYKIPASQLK